MKIKLKVTLFCFNSKCFKKIIIIENSFARRWTQIDPRPCKYSNQCDFPPKPGTTSFHIVSCIYFKLYQVSRMNILINCEHFSKKESLILIRIK